MKNEEKSEKHAENLKEKKEKKEKIVKDKNLKKGKKNKIIIICITIFVILIFGMISYFLYWKFGPKFKDVNVELGTQEITLDQFLAKESYKDKSKFITDISTLDLSKLGSYEIELEYDDLTQKVTLNVVDTTPPEVEFKDISKYLDYEIKADDFIKSKKDLSEMTTSVINPPEINGIGTYQVNVEVKDSSNNTTNKICNLEITRVVKEFTLELGEKLKKENILLNIKEDEDTIDQKDIDKINKSDVGEYELVSDFDGTKETIKIIIKDTKAPELKLREVTIYSDEKIDSVDDFISSVKDASDDITTNLKTEIDYSKIGEQEIVIEAKDKYGNKTEKKTTLTIKEDNEGPVFYGLDTLYVSKHSSVNYKSGVSAIDDRDGSVSFSVNSNSVDVDSAGTYYAKYTAKDEKGNTTTRNRVIVVEHDQEDTDNKFNSFYNKYLAGKSVSGIVSAVRNQISYDSSWGGDDPVWYGLTNYSGNCYVHALLVKKALDRQGIENQLIYTTDKTHYWNLVKSGGVWRHYDATPTAHIAGPATDEEKANSSAMNGRKWPSSFPKAE